MTTIVNPWFSVWTKPRSTIRQIVDSDPKRLTLLLICLVGIGSALDQMSKANVGDTLSIPVIFLIAAILGPIASIITWYISAYLLKWTGGWLKGQANLVNIRTAMAWSYIPMVVILMLWIPMIAIFGGELFTTETPNMDGNQGLAMALIGFAVVQAVLTIWCLIVYLKMLGEVQGFSAWKALGNSLLAGLIIAIPVVAIAIGVGMITG